MENQTYKTPEPQFLEVDPILTPGTPEHRKAYLKAYRAKNSERLRSYDRNRYCGERKRQLRVRNYDLTPTEYDRLLDSQVHCCAICGTHQSQLKSTLCIDHDHKTGKVRGLICDLCNRGIGMLQDNPDVLDRASAYLRRYTNQSVDVLTTQ